MDLLFCLERMLTDFRHLFNSKNFVLFQAFIIGLITDTPLDASLSGKCFTGCLLGGPPHDTIYRFWQLCLCL